MNSTVSIETDSFFVYGTLKSGQMNEWVLQPFEAQREAAWTHGHLFDVGAFPAMSAGDGTVHGELVRCKPGIIHRALVLVDDLEGYFGDNSDSMYLRRIVDVCTRDGANCRAIAYFYNPDSQELPPLHDLQMVPEGRWDGPSRRKPIEAGGLTRYTQHVEHYEPPGQRNRQQSVADEGMDHG